MASNIQGQEIKQEKPSSSTSDTTQEQEKFERKIFDCIAEDLPPDQWKRLVFNLGLTFDHLSEVDVSSNGQPTLYIKHLWDKWKNLQNPKPYQLIPLLSSALEAIGRNDIVKKIKQIKLEKITEERKVKTGTIKEPEKFEEKIFDCIAEPLSSNEWKNFGTKLGLTLNELMDLEKDSIVLHEGRPYTIKKMLGKWKQANTVMPDQLISLLTPPLQEIKRNDIIRKIQQIEEEERNSMR